jgi:CIC family chloride channel protein
LVVGGEIRGILSRRDLKSALTEHIVPVPTPPVICGPDLSVREVGSLLMESQSGMVLVRNGPSEDLLTVVTLHDLIRAQASFSD